jgi:hypothetical protein
MTKAVVLQSLRTATQLDRFDYNDDLHFALINDTEGYSLERISPDRPATSDNTNWQSASDVAGKATPGFLNSQYAPTANASGEMSIDPALFSPDNDGFEDVLTIAYRFEQAGFVGNMSIYDIAGREVRALMENNLLGHRRRDLVGMVFWTTTANLPHRSIHRGASKSSIWRGIPSGTRRR